MEISVNQIHNVLRTYRNLFKGRSHQIDRKRNQESDSEESNPSIHDSVSLSTESIKRLEKAEKEHRKASLPEK